MYASFAEGLSVLMAERGIGVRALARRVPCNPGYVSKLRSGKEQPSPELARRIDDALDAEGKLAATVPPRTPAPTSPRSALVAVVDSSDGVITPDDEERLVRAARSPSRLDACAVDSLAAILAEQRRLEDAIGSAPLVDPVRAQLATLETLVVDARGKLRPRVLDVSAQWAQFSGWLYLNTGHFAEAHLMYDRALEWAVEIDDANMVATALNMKGHASWIAGKAGPVIGLSQAAQRSRAASPGVLSLAAQQEARGHAMMGDGQSAERKLDEAATLTLRAAEHREDEPPWVYFFNADYLVMQRALAYLLLGRNGEAVELLTAGLAALPADVRRSEWVASYLCRLARAHEAAGDLDEAHAAAMEAASIARGTGSPQLRRQLRRLHARMAEKWPGHAAVAELVAAVG